MKSLLIFLFFTIEAHFSLSVFQSPLGSAGTSLISLMLGRRSGQF